MTQNNNLPYAEDGVTGRDAGAYSDGDLRPSYWRPTAMSTVVVTFQTGEGFVIGSDSRKSIAGRVVGDDAQKIFPIRQQSGDLAYGLAGSVLLGDANDVVIFDFGVEVARLTERLSHDRQRDWFSYVSKLATEVNDSLNESRRSLTLADSIESTWIFIGGIFGRHLKGAHIVFNHGPKATTVEPFLHPPNFTFGPFGSGVLFDLIDSEDARVTQYSNPKRAKVRTLSDAILRARNDVLAHCDPVGIEIDKGHCWSTGGKPQIATVTFANGFQWVPGAEPPVAVQ